MREDGCAGETVPSARAVGAMTSLPPNVFLIAETIYTGHILYDNIYRYLPGYRESGMYEDMNSIRQDIQVTQLMKQIWWMRVGA